MKVRIQVIMNGSPEGNNGRWRVDFPRQCNKKIPVLFDMLDEFLGLSLEAAFETSFIVCPEFSPFDSERTACMSVGETPDVDAPTLMLVS